ncbi:MAG: hypothetical protein ACRD3G_08295 [Vicinamibacterales bacterium]
MPLRMALADQTALQGTGQDEQYTIFDPSEVELSDTIRAVIERVNTNSIRASCLPASWRRTFAARSSTKA